MLFLKLYSTVRYCPLCSLKNCLFLELRDPIGDSAVAGDLRWAGSYGVNIDFVARSHCAVETITIEEIQVLSHCSICSVWCLLKQQLLYTTALFSRVLSGQNRINEIKPIFTDKAIWLACGCANHRKVDVGGSL
jgi:hypothetical protein